MHWRSVPLRDRLTRFHPRFWLELEHPSSAAAGDAVQSSK